MPEPDVIAVIHRFKLAILARERQQMQEMARQWLSLERQMDGQVTALAHEVDRLRREQGGVPEWKLYELERTQSLLRQLRNEVDRYSEYADGLITQRQFEVGASGIDQSVQAIRAMGVRDGFDRLPVSAIENMVGLAGNGSPLRELLEASWPEAADGLMQALIEGVGRGWGPDRIAREMQRGMSRGLNRALTIARTEQLRVYREASRQQYIESGVVEGYRRNATKDGRACPACLMDDGAVYQLGEVMPEHPNGRCAMVPIVIGMPAVEWELGKDWFMNQPEADQRNILGRGRYQAWQEGRFDLEQLVSVRRNSTWGDSVQPTPLKDLG